MGERKKVMLIGWDAADWKVINELVGKGMMPNVGKMIDSGTMGNMRTLSPVLSPMLWTSIATGKRPFKHGIYGFTEPTPGGGSVRPVTNTSRRCKAIWNILNQNGMKSLVVSWWPSHPAEPISGVMVSDFFHKAPKQPTDPWKLMPRCVYPESMTERIAELRVHPKEIKGSHVLPFVPKGDKVDQAVDPRLSMVVKMLAECKTVHATVTDLLEHEEWDFAAIYYDSIDHFSHGFMKYRAPKQSQISDQDFGLYKDVVTTAYVYHDTMLGRLVELGGPDTTYILMSDHGFHSDHLRPRIIPSEPAGPAVEHRDYGIFLAQGPGIKRNHLIYGANLLDITPTILSIYGLPIGEDMDGRALQDIFENRPEIKAVPSWENYPGEDGQHPAGMEIAPNDSKEAIEQLVALGYIDLPDEDVDKAIADCQQELDYNLARSYMDAGMHGRAASLLLNLYKKRPLELRFGFQLSNCLRAMGRIDDLETIVRDLKSRWLTASSEARKRMQEILVLKKERLEHWYELKKIDDRNDGDETKPKLAKIEANGTPMIWDKHELRAIAKIRSVATENSQTLDFLLATIASARGDFESALKYLEKAKPTKSQNSGFQFQIGNVYLGLNRLEDAENVFLKALDVDESHPMALMGLCRTYVKQQQFEKAIGFGKQAIRLKFQFPLAHYFLGLGRKGVGDIDGAIQSIKTAIRQNPNFADAHQTLASIYDASHLNEALASHHASTARQLLAAKPESNTTATKIELPKYDSEYFRNQLKQLGDFRDGEHVDFVRCIGQPKSALFAAVENQPEVIIVSGLPRSGTSTMMQVLQAGGIEPFTDQSRTPDENNPRGYLEAEIVKQLRKKNNWVSSCGGKVIKVVAPLIPFLPQGVRYKVVFMDRDLSEILSSQAAMLERLEKKGGKIDLDRLGKVFTTQTHSAKQALADHQHPVFVASYQAFIEEPERSLGNLVEFFGSEIYLEKDKMLKAIDPGLYRQQKKR